MTTFIDAHCHFFNFVDIPVYETLDGQVCMNTAAKLMLAMSASGAMLSGLIKHKVHDYKEFVQFFEQPIEANLYSIAESIVGAEHPDLLVLTPLAMDFDCVRQECGGDCKPCHDETDCRAFNTDSIMKGDPSVKGQYYRLLEAIGKLKQKSPGWANDSVKVLPFLGFDLRKLTPQNSTALADLQTLWSDVGLQNSARPDSFDGIPNGTAVGIKLYPPIGFNPNPKNQATLKAYKEFYDWCIDERIPITVHCQSGSYSANRKASAVDKDTRALNWRSLFEDWGQGPSASTRDIRNLRINFAHFGGEDGLEDMIDPFRQYGVDQNSWTYHIVHMIRHYKNAYADLSAFDWSDTGAVDNLIEVLDLEARGTLDQIDHDNNLPAAGYTVRDKLMWGSDVPMILSDKAYRKNMERHGECGYEYLLDNFKSVMEPASIINRMTEATPTQFLLG